MTASTVLIIEDDPTLLRGLKDNFQSQAYRVQTACDGEAGLAAALNDGRDLILLDIMLPKMNGYEICRVVRPSSKRSRTSAIALRSRKASHRHPQSVSTSETVAPHSRMDS